MTLSNRMKELCSLVPRGSVIADIGCDHAFVDIALVQDGICPRTLAMDVKKGPLELARAHVEEAQLQEKIQLRLSDGLDGLENGEVNGIIMAGMGGRLMKQLLEKNEEKAKKLDFLILQPQSELHEFRVFLKDSGYSILQNRLMKEEGKYYFFIQAVYDEDLAYYFDPTKNGLEEFLDDYYGIDLIKGTNMLVLEFLEQEQKQLVDILEELDKIEEPTEAIRGRMKEVKRLLTVNESAYMLAKTSRLDAGTIVHTKAE